MPELLAQKAWPEQAEASQPGVRTTAQWRLIFSGETMAKRAQGAYKEFFFIHPVTRKHGHVQAATAGVTQPGADIHQN